MSADRAMASLPAAISSHIEFRDGCWEWQGYRDANGYGRIRRGGTQRAAHRVVYELLVGPVPAGAVLDHLCLRKACVRPEHLDAVTPAENTRRWWTINHIRNARLLRHGHAAKYELGDRAIVCMALENCGGRAARQAIARRCRP